MMSTKLSSTFLVDLAEQFQVGVKGFPRARDNLEIMSVEGATVLQESVEILGTVHVRDLWLFHRLVIWGDGIANYVVRENVKKRQGKLVYSLMEFVAGDDAKAIVRAFWQADLLLERLEVPPGVRPSDLEVLNEIEERWLTLGHRGAH